MAPQAQSKQRTNGWSYGFTLIELLVTVSIIAILAALLLGAIAKGKGKARKTECISNMHQLIAACAMYSDESRDVIVPMAKLVRPYPSGLIVNYPPYVWWPDTLRPYTKGGPRIYSCPDAPETQSGQYLTNKLGIGMNLNELGVFSDEKNAKTLRFVKYSMVNIPAETVFFGDVAYVENWKETNADLWTAWPDRFVTWRGCGMWIFETPGARNNEWNRNPVRIINRHNGLANCGWVDGHVQAVKTSTIGWQYKRKDPRAMWDR